MTSPPISPKDSGFIPRREFIRDPKPPPNSFSLLAISGSSCIRLYSFTPSIINSLRVFFRQTNLLQGFREDVDNQFFEFTVEGKPWSSAKSVATERLLIEILSVISHHGYNFLSTLDYGRESDDRVALAFSRPASPSQSSSPSHTPIPPANGSGTTLSGRPRSYPFALSFSSITTLRVIAPPLAHTPAILQAVRGAWPRGVESEKKIGDNCFEFKLKGYKWFHEDTFATDSLRHILSLLSALDTHSFVLQTSLSLTNSRSKVKDLWIFTGPPTVDDTAFHDSTSVLNASPEFSRAALSPDPFVSPSPLNSPAHRRLVTEPTPLQSPRPASPLRHGRTVTDDPQTHGDAGARVNQGSPTPPNVLRKPAPRAQVPVSVHDADATEGEEYRTVLPSTIPSGIENMTGIGAGGDPAAAGARTPDVFYSTSPFGSPPEPAEAQLFRTPSPRVPSPYVQPQPQTAEFVDTQDGHTPEMEEPPTFSTILSPGTFRDSVLSATTDVSAVIPIKWTGTGRDSLDVDPRVPSTPMFPGGWQPTPVIEKDEQLESPKDKPLDIHLDQDREPDNPVQDVRVGSPEITDGQTRQSEAGLIVTAATPVALEKEEPGAEDEKDKERRQTTASSGTGWVLVNVEGKSPSPDDAPVSPAGQDEAQSSAIPAVENGSPPQPTPVLPAAKAIVIVDAIDSKKSKAKKDSPSRIRRFLSLTRRDSGDKSKTQSRSTVMGEKLRRIGTPEATRNDERRRSFD